jgi:hypothetical protein
MSAVPVPLAWRWRALLVDFLVERGVCASGRPVAGLMALGVPRTTAYRFEADYRRWVRLGCP